MAKDIRKLFEQARKRPPASLPEGHEARFLEKLEKVAPRKKTAKYRRFQWTRIAAAILFLCVGWGIYAIWKNSQADVRTEILTSDTKAEPSPEKPLTLSDISPDLKKVEAYFVSSIKVELASLKVTEQQREMVDAYLLKVKALGEEYKKLNEELNTVGVNDMTITALIENLKLRLQLLQRLKKNLNHPKNETYEKESSSRI